jgi:hypothetical protein
MAVDHYVNPQLIDIARQSLGSMGGFSKFAFVPGGDPSMGGAPADPAAGGGGGDPAAAAGGGGGGGGGDALGALTQQMQQMQQQMMQMQGGGGGMGGGMAGGAGAGAKGMTPKIDEKAVMLQILKILARIADFLKVPIPASEMVVNQQDMMGLAQATTQGGPMPGMDPSVGGGGGGGGDPSQAGAIPPIDPMQAAGQPGAGMGKTSSLRVTGTAFDTAQFATVGNKAAAIARLRQQRNAA